MFNILTTRAQREFKNLFINNFKSGLDDCDEELLAWQFIRDGGSLDIKNRQNKPLIFYCCEKGFSSILKFFMESHKLKINSTYIVYIDELYDMSTPQTPNVFISPSQTFHKYYSLNLLEYACFYGQNKIIDFLNTTPYFKIKNCFLFNFNSAKDERFDCLFLSLYNKHFHTAHYILQFLDETQTHSLFERSYYHKNFLSKEAKEFVQAIQEKARLEKEFLKEKIEINTKKKTFKI